MCTRSAGPELGRCRPPLAPGGLVGKVDLDRAGAEQIFVGEPAPGRRAPAGVQCLHSQGASVRRLRRGRPVRLRLRGVGFLRPWGRRGRLRWRDGPCRGVRWVRRLDRLRPIGRFARARGLWAWRGFGRRHGGDVWVGWYRHSSHDHGSYRPRLCCVAMTITLAAAAPSASRTAAPRACPAASDHQREPAAPGAERSNTRAPDVTVGAGDHHRASSARVMCHTVRVSLINVGKRPWGQCRGGGLIVGSRTGRRGSGEGGS